MSITIGRAGVGFENGLVVSSVDTDGDVVVVNGWIRDQGSLADVTALRGQLNGLAGNTDEPVVPVVWSDGDGSINGFYRVGRVSVGSEPRIRLNADSVLPFSVELVAVPGWQAPLFEVLSRGADRVSATSTAAAAVSWVSGPGSLDSSSLNVDVSGPVTVQGDGSTAKVWYHDDRLYSGALSYQVGEAGFYDGACRVEVDAVGDGSYRSVVGRQVPNLVGRWRLSNDVVRVYPGGLEQDADPQALDLPGGAGDGASSPDKAAFDITGSIDIMVRITADDLTPATEQVLMSKWDEAGNQRSYMLSLRTDGKLSFRVSSDGTSVDSWVSDTAVTGSGPLWMRATMNASNGRCDFWTSADDTNTPTAVTWTSLNLGITLLGALTVHSGTAALHVGTAANTTLSPAAGTVHAAALYSGHGPDSLVSGTPAATPTFADAAQFTIGGNGTDPQGNSWTVNANAEIVATAAPTFGGGTSDDYAIEVFDPVTNEWQTKVYNVTTGGATPTSLGIAKAVTVLRNSPETCAVRVHTNATGGAYIDFTIRRGSWVVEGFVANAHTSATNRAFGLKRKIVEAATVETGGLVATSADAKGHKYRIFTASAHTADTTNGAVYLSSAADQFSFAATTDTHDGTITARGLHWAAVNHRQQVVAR